MIAADMPPWKAEYLGKKRRKEKGDEVPLWKRELLKRIHSKNQRLTEEQADIVEEHIPKVSDNIFLIHEKKYRSVPPPKVKLPPKPIETISAKSAVPVENVIIIEKDHTTETNMSATSEEVIAKEEEEEYPSVGIVHRLMGRFQKGKASAHRNVYHIPPYQRSKNAEPADEPAKVTVIEKPAVAVDSKPAMAESVPDLHPRTQVGVAGDYMAPLLISSARPFSRSVVSNAQEHKYHHVDIPVRKISSSSAPKSPSFDRGTEMSTDEETFSIDAFTADLSNLHSNREVSSPQRKVDSKEPAAKDKPAEKRVNLVNGDSLHSSGNAGPVAHETKVENVSTLQDKSNFSSYNAPKPKVSEAKPVAQPNRYKADRPALETHSRVKPPVSPKRESKPPFMKENRTPSKKPERNRDAFKEVVNESFDEATMKSTAALAANRIMKSSKTFKITPKNVPQSATTPSSTYGNKTSEGNQKAPQHEEKTRFGVEQPKMKSYVQTKSEVERVSVSHPIRHTKEETKDELPSTCIDDLITDPPLQTKPLFIRPVATLPASKGDNSIKEINIKEKKTTVSSPVATPPDTKEPELNNLITKESNTTPVVTKAQNNHALLGPKTTAASTGVKKAGFGKSFTIDPSKFRKSSAQSADAGGASINRAGGNTRTIIPKRAQGAAGGQLDTGDDTPKPGKRKLTVDQITVIGGYVSLERSCLVKGTKRKKGGVTISFCEKKLETTYTYASERSMLVEEKGPPLPAKDMAKAPGFGKDSTIGKYTPKYLLSMKENIPDDEDEDSGALSPEQENKLQATKPQMERASEDATPLSDDSAIAWSDTTSGSTDILF